MTAALDALSRLDDGDTLPGDRTLADLFDQHIQWDANPCLVCGAPHGGPECLTCVVAADMAATRAEDI